jgi:PIN domain nuclease of toxin-antitoxin system
LRILLDTCTFLWLAEGDPALSHRAREAIVDPTNEVYLSPTSVWEIVIKHALGRLVLNVPADRYVPEQRELHRVDTLPVTETAALQLARLPLHHRDPFDRLLVAQAVAEGCTIATPDPLIRRYPVSTIW